MLRLLFPLLLWLVAFSAIYGLHGLVCSQHSDLSGALPARGVLIGAWIVAVLMQTAVLVALYRRPSASRLIRSVATILGWTAVAAMLWSLFPVLLSGCS